MCETCDLGITWHAFLSEGQVAVDMRGVCSQDVKKTLLKQARMVHWEKWAAKHEYEDLTEVVWVDAKEDK